MLPVKVTTPFTPDAGGVIGIEVTFIITPGIVKRETKTFLSYKILHLVEPAFSNCFSHLVYNEIGRKSHFSYGLGRYHACYPYDYGHVMAIKTKYARMVAVGITFASVGELLCHLFIHTKTNTYALYGGNAYIPAQAGVMVDVFILGYGLSLRNAESDKKLILTLLENEQIMEEERSRLAKDLHDGLGGLLSGIKLTLHSISDSIPEKIVPVFLKVSNQLDSVIKEMRRVAHNMMPEALLKFGLGEAIQDFCDGLNESHIIKMKYTQIGSLQALTQSNAIVLYRMIQELTNNALKHAKAKNIFIQITKHQQGITITVEDDGIGFNSLALPNTNGDGFKNLQTRIDYLKGTWDIKSEISNGTSINIEIPV